MATWETAGKVRMTPKGVYDATATYEVLDVVSNADNSITYIAKQAVPAGTALTNTAYWAVVISIESALAGIYNDIESALSYIAGEFSTSTAYSVNDYVVYDNELYRFTTNHQAGAWNSSHVTRVTFSSEVSSFKTTLDNFNAFDITVVNSLPTTGSPMTFYLVPKASGNGYDKYWWITDENDVAKWDMFGGSTTQIVTTLPQDPDPDVDYILKTDAGCLYYKYIDNAWNVVAGSLAVVANTLPQTGNSYTDYYILDANNDYIHYRYISNDFHRIGTTCYTKSEVDTLVNGLSSRITTNANDLTTLSGTVSGLSITVSTHTTNISTNAGNISTLSSTVSGLSGSISTNTNNISTNAGNIQTLSNTIGGIQQTLSELDTTGVTYYATYGTAEISGETVENVYTLYEVDGSDETIVSQFVITGGSGGGGGGQSATTLVVERITTSPLVVTPSDSVNIQFTYSSLDGDNEQVDGTYTWKLGSTVIATGACVHGTNTFDATDYCSIGTQKFTLTVVDEGGSTVVKTWTVQKVDVRLESSFNDRVTYPVGSSVNFSYTPYGSVSKTIHFILDGTELTSVTTAASGTLQSYSLSAQTHGSHLLECYITATINGSDVETEHIFKDIIWYDSTSTIPVIGCIYRCLSVPYNATYDEDTKYYYIDPTTHLYAAYTGGSAGWSARPQLYYKPVDIKQYDTINMDYVVYNPTTGRPTVTQSIDGVDSTISMSTYYNTLTFKTEDAGVHSATLTCGVTSVGIILDVEELDIDVTPITSGLVFDFNPVGRSNSSENRMWVDANNSSIALSVSSNFDWANGGYKIDSNGNQYFCVKAGTTATFSYNLFGTNPYTTGAHFKLIFQTDNIRDINTTWMSCFADSVGIKMKAHEADIYTSADVLDSPYSEGDMIEFEYNIDILDTENANADSVIMTYEDGVAFRPLIYDTAHRIHQYNPVNIVFGSQDCDVRIYRMKAYNVSLTDSNTISNFIADAPNSDLMISRYNRNQIYNINNVLTPESLAAACPDLKIIKIDAPKFTNNKSESISNTTIQCIHTNGDSVLDNWTARNCQHSGQGTTSNEYGVSGRNLDLKLNEDDVVLTLGNGTTYNNGTGKVTLTRTSVPNNYFNVKVNIASSENANNALLAKRYERYLPYTTPAKRRDEKIKSTMEFVNCAIFIRENDEDLTTHREFNDTQWHFYGIGNIGDSKKTDKTRVNDPSDTKEWVNEILDNTLANSIFDTGVVNLLVESLPATGNLFTDYYTKNQNGKYTLKRYLNNSWSTVSTTIDHIENGAVAIVSSLPQEGVINIEYYIAGNNGYTMYTWNGTSWSAGSEQESIVNSHMANTIDPLQWVSGNVKYDSLHAAESGGKWGTTTYEFRYEHKSASSAQHEANKQKWFDFYAWVITSTDAEFVDELEDWFIKDAALYYYLFTERYTMSDNRSKNTFWHWGKVYISETEAAGDYASTKQYFTIDNAKAAINDGYRMDFWGYDFDTALGINNSGELKATYGKEDIDYQIEDDPSSGYVFNGAENVFYRRIRLLLHDDLAEMYRDRESVGAWTTSALVNEFDEWQEEWPEELWRLDIQRKYYRPYYGNSVDGSIPKTSDRFLKTMMNGRKRYQRRQFERDQAIYMGTKYLSSEVRANQIMFRCNTPQSAVVTPNYTLNIVPYSDMYLSVVFGNSAPDQVRAKAGQTYTMYCPLSTMDDTAILIYAASRIQALNDLSACYIHDNDFSNAEKLQTLVIGNSTSGYNNPFLTTLTLGNNVLLKTLDIRNCHNLVGSLNLSYCINLQTLRAEGTSIGGVIFANNGKASLVYLPSTVTSLTMRNLQSLNTINGSLDNLESLVLENGILDTIAFITDVSDSLRTLSLSGINWTLPSTTLLNTLLNLNTSYIAGSVYVSGAIRNSELSNYAAAWPDLTVTYDPMNLVTQYLVTFVNYNGTTLYTEYVDRGYHAVDPVTAGYISAPIRPADQQYSYVFSTWDGIDDAILSNRTLTAVYENILQSYTVTWYSRAGLPISSVTADYGDEVIYNGNVPVNTSEENIYIYNIFSGWNKSTGFIREDTNVYAIWDRSVLPEQGKDISEMSTSEIYAVCKSNQQNDYFEVGDEFDFELGHDFNFENVQDVEFGTDSVLTGIERDIDDHRVHYFDGESAFTTNIVLLGENSPPFTMAIDFQFANTTADLTLVSNNEGTTTSGFRLYMSDSRPKVQWGDQTASIGYGKERNIVVIRHPKDSRYLYVYSGGNTNSSGSFNNTVTKTNLFRSAFTATEEPLSFGAVRINEGFRNYGKGVMHWCKLWYDDIGDANATQLALWPHEKLKMKYFGSGKYYYYNSNDAAKASWYCTSLIGGINCQHGYAMNANQINTGGWKESAARQFCNGRLLQSLPIKWQSILSSVEINSTIGNGSTVTSASENKIYMPCLREVYSITSAGYISEVGTSTDLIPWMTSDNNRRMWRGFSRDYSNSVDYYSSDQEPAAYYQTNIVEGSIWRKSGYTYMFISQDKINKYGIVPSYTADIEYASGGWVRSDDYNLRSPYVGSDTIWAYMSYSGGYGGSSGSSNRSFMFGFSI